MRRVAAFSLAAAVSAAALAEPPLPEPFATKSVTKHPVIAPWPEGKTPAAPAGFTVTPFVTGLENPRWLYVLPNGDVLVAQSRTPPPKKAEPEQKKGLEKSKTAGASPNRITLLRDTDRDGTPDLRETFAEGLNQPLGMALVGDTFYVANQDGVRAFPYREGQTKLSGQGRLVLDLPAGGYNNHWTRNLLASPDGSKLYVSVGSGSNVAEYGTGNEILRANVLECNPDGTGLRVFASGLRNPVGMAWEPGTKTLWTAVNERDHLGDELVPDYLTSVKDGAFYGWPYSYYGRHEDPRRKGERPDLVAKAVVPDVPLGAHTASLGLAFAPGAALPGKYREGAFVSQRGSWNRSAFAGYKVVFVPFAGGKPSGPPEDFLTGFVKNDSEVYGRPVGVAFAADGALLVCDEPSDRVWRVAAGK